ncbi:IclR family transcriptional regulator [Nocardiopsis sp. NPDC058631]|uniref:IclR family transcriptional regulator n=1 Tax=Nocardiopsis sp. NPDC058631 TaxID=3346566 RepID=UPI003653B611
MSTGPTERAGPLQPVDRALDVLLSFDEYRTSWGVLELADEFGLTRSAAQRLLASLAGRGFPRADPDTRRYGMGPAMWRMAGLWERSGGLSALAEPLLADLARTSLFCVPDGAHVRCIAAVSGSEGPRRSHPFLAELYPAHAGATSRACFAFLDPAERGALLSGRPSARFFDLTPFDEREVETLFDTTVGQGYALSQGEYDAASRAPAVPVFGGKRPVGPVTLVENKHSDHDDDLLDHLTPPRSAGGELTGPLSNRRPAPPTRRWRRGHGSRPSPHPTTD